MYERIHSGIDTTPDETANLIESFYLICTRLWIAEALNIEKSYPNIFQDALGQNLLRFVYDFLLAKRNLTIGFWVFVARQIRVFFQNNNISPFTKGLMSLDLGASAQSDTPTKKLLDFRNHFAHGAFHAEKEHVQEHYELLSSCIKKVSGLYTQHFVVCTQEQWFLCTKESSPIEPPIANVEKGVFLVNPEDQTNMQLSGLFSFSENKINLVQSTLFSSEELFYSELLQGFFAQYTKEKNGDISFEQEFCDTERVIPEEVYKQIQKELKKENNACLVEAYPGSDVENILHHHKDFGKPFDAYFIWNIKKNDITMSGRTFAYKIMRIVESLIPEIEQKKKELFIEKFDRYMNVLEQNNKKICVFIHNLHTGLNSYRGESHLLVDIYNRLLETNTSIIATVEPGQVRNGIFHESIFSYPAQIHHPEALKERIHTMIQNPIKKQIIQALANKENQHLFDICDAIDTIHGEGYTFEPEIEYALWDISPILSTKRIEKQIENESANVRVWSLFHPSIAEYIQ
jgi:hypothetical protein